MQTLLLVRHAIAEERGPAWPDDSLRPLTKKGIARMREVARRLKEVGETADLIASSPFKRAMDTALILVTEWTVPTGVQTVKALAPGHTPSATIAAIADEPSDQRIALVGHEPDLGQFAAWLIGAKRPVPFKKGGIARIDVETLRRPRDGQLVWLATPKLLT
jgi:phosphohistidine phosphatase